VEFLERLAARPEHEREFQRVVVLLKMLVILVLIGAGWWIWRQAPELSELLLVLGV
jgi:hypothetical protein